MLLVVRAVKSRKRNANDVGYAVQVVDAGGRSALQRFENTAERMQWKNNDEEEKRGKREKNYSVAHLKSHFPPRL